MKIKLRPLLPSLREKKRYLVYEVISDKPLKFEDTEKAIKNGILQFLGELGYAKAGILILPQWKESKGILRINNKELTNVRAALSLIHEVNNKKIMIKSIGVSGILKKAKQRYFDKMEVN